MLGCVAPIATEQPASDGRYTMGTVLEISLHGLESQPAARALDDLYAVAAELDGLLSVYQPDSDISQLNRTAGRGPQAVDPAVAEVLRLSIAYSDLTQGAFDVTIGPLVELWEQAAARNAIPTAAELTDARARVGSDQIDVGPDGAVSLAREGMKINLGGIAKGHALDRMLPLLEQHGVESALLNFGQSSTWARGAPPGSPGWRLLVREPGGGFAGTIVLRNQALSVSGSLGQWVEIGGRRYGHIIDPRSGELVTSQRQAVVVARDAGLAEALSTALLVLDPDVGLAVVTTQPDCEALLIEATGELHSTPGWAASVRFEPLPTGANTQ
jgi:thiamine biosynthesis lipoprotein